MYQGYARGTFCGDEEGCTAAAPCLCCMFWFPCPICVFLHTFSGTEGLKLIYNVQKAFQRCQHVTAVAIVKMHLPSLSSMA